MADVAGSMYTQLGELLLGDQLGQLHGDDRGPGLGEVADRGQHHLAAVLAAGDCQEVCHNHPRDTFLDFVTIGGLGNSLDDSYDDIAGR